MAGDIDRFADEVETGARFASMVLEDRSAVSTPPAVTSAFS